MNEKTDRFPFKFQMTMTFEMRDEIDQWRRKQEGIPSRVDAIRQLLRRQIDADKKVNESNG